MPAKDVEIAPCPFCGGTFQTSYEFEDGVRVQCIECGSEGSTGTDLEEAVHYWNKRSEPRLTAIAVMK